MRADQNASIPKRKATKAFYSELPDKDARFGPLYSPQRNRINDEAEQEQQGTTKSWHTFKTP
jgi:hypothetical protein